MGQVLRMPQWTVPAKGHQQRTTPPFRADHVGSLLRTARAEGGAGEARQERDHATRSFAEIEDREIEKIIKKQEEVGLKLATDGEFRRSWWQFDFYKGLDGVEMFDTGRGHHVRRRRDQGRERSASSASSASPAIRISSISSF